MSLTRVLLTLFCGWACFPQTGFDPAALDKSVNPCADFYQFACGNWLKNNPIPADQSTWGRLSELHERNQRNLRDILETSAAKTSRTPVEQKIGDYFSSCMDEKGIEQKGVQPLEPILKRIAGLSSKNDFTAELVKLHRDGVNAMFGISSGQDFKDATEVIANIDKGVLGLPVCDYYLKDDHISVVLRKH